MQGDAEANYAYYALHEFHILPSDFLGLDDYELAFVIAAIDIRVDKEKKKQAEIERKAKK